MRLMILILAIALSLLATSASAKPRVAGCDNGFLRLKVWADPQRFDVDHRPTRTNLIEVYRIVPPATQPGTRVSRWQRRQWSLRAQIVEYRLDHGEIRLVLYWDDTKYMNVAIPSPACLLKETRQRDRIVRTYRKFIDRCGTPTARAKSLGAVVKVTGVGFWANKNYSRLGQAPSGAELHPVTDLELIAGCGT